MSDTLYLQHHDAGGGTLSLSEDAKAKSVLIPHRNKRVAALVWTNTAVQVIISELTGSAKPVSVQLSSDSHGETGQTDTQDHHSDDSLSWGGVWSPDGRLLVVYGGRSTNPSLWVLTHRAWIDDSANEAQSSELMKVQIDLRSQLQQDAQWRRHKAAATAVAGAFFQSKTPSRCFLLTRDAWLLKMEIQTAELLVHVRSGDATIKTGFFRTSSVMRLSNWHGDINASAFEATSSTLVVAGGLKNPSQELRSQRASSLSVWSVTADEPFVELLDYTMIPGSNSADDEDNGDTVPSPASNETQSTLIKSMRRSLFNPLKLIQGEGDEDADAVIVPGSIRHVAISSDGVFLSIVHLDGRFRLRQIDVCADVTPWQLAEDYTPTRVDEIAWLGPTSLAFRSRHHHVCFGFLASTDSEDAANQDDDGGGAEDEEQQQQLRTPASVHVVMQRVMSDAAVDAMKVQAISSSTLSEDTSQLHALSLHDGAAWQLATLETSTPRALVDRLLASQQLDKALALAEHCRERADELTDVDVDSVYRQLWTQYRASVLAVSSEELTIIQTSEDDGLDQALGYLNGVASDKAWVVTQCLTTITTDSASHMKEILATGLRAAVTLADDERHARATLLRYLYRLETLQAMLQSECLDPNQPTYDGVAFASFRDASLVTTAEELATQARVQPLTVLFRRHAWNLVPHRLAILARLPAITPPSQYVHLLPAVGPSASLEWQLYTLRLSTSDDAVESYDIAAVELLVENRSHDLSAVEAAAFDAYAGQDPEHRRGEYALWFTQRMAAMDAVFGQLHHAVALGKCARAACLRADALAEVDATPLREFLDHSERFARCVHALQLPACRALSLEDWSLLSLHDQVLLLLQCDPEQEDEDGVVHTMLHRLHTVFVAPRTSLDEVISWLCQALLARHAALLHASADPLKRLALCAALLHESNPASPRAQRWIQDNARLLRTALDVAYAARASDLRAHTDKQRHGQLVESLWRVFQSLPVRTEADSDEIGTLQVQVDELEDWLVAMDVLAVYHVLTSPAELRERVTSDNTEAVAVETVDAMAQYAVANGVAWTAVWQDALQLKTHAFGERLSVDTVLARLAMQWLMDTARLGETHELLVHWASTAADALPRAVELVAARVRQLADADELVAAAQLVAMAQSVAAASPSLSEKLARVLTKAQRVAKLQELLALLSHGQLRLARHELQELRSESERLGLVLRLLSLDASHYCLRPDAVEWLQREGLVPATASVDTAIDGVLCLAKLLRVTSPRGRAMVVAKTAYAALYCSDYEAAHRLATRVVEELPAAEEEEEGEDEETMELVLSLVLELVSASAFRDWQKKLALLRSLVATGSHRSGFWRHPLADVLLQRLQWLEASHSLANELGLSATDLATRQNKDDEQKELLAEVAIVVELLREDASSQSSSDAAVMTLLQKALALVVHAQSHAVAPLASSLSGDSSSSEREWIARTLEQLAVLALDAALRDGDERGQQDDLALAYVLQLATTESTVLDTAWHDALLPRLQTSESPSKQHIVQRFQCLFQSLAQSSLSNDDTLEATATTTTASTLFATLASQCTALLHSHHATQELETVARLVADTSIDLARFAADEAYRLATLRQLPTSQESLAAALELARKYAVDEYECLLAYVRHAFLGAGFSITATQRQQQLEAAFRGTTDQQDLLDQLLQRPRDFAALLLHEIYDRLDGTDHVGLLLVLRMLLECSKRCDGSGDQQAASESPPLPFAKPVADRLTLLFLCLKRLKEVGDPDFKRVCGAGSVHALLHGVADPAAAQREAIAAIRDFLTPASVKMLTKVLAKLHGMTASAVVMVFVDAVLSRHWSGDQQLAVEAAYDSCTASFLSVLSLEHLLVLDALVLGGGEVEIGEEQFYGQRLEAIAVRGGELSRRKRLAIAADHASLVHVKTAAMSEAEAGTYTVRMDQRVVMEAVWLVAECGGSSDALAAEMAAWFATEDRSVHVGRVVEAITVWSVEGASLPLASLLLTLALSLTTASAEDTERRVAELYCKAAVAVVQRVASDKRSEKEGDAIVRRWATQWSGDEGGGASAAARELRGFLATVNGSVAADAVYQQVLAQLSIVASPALKKAVEQQQQRASGSTVTVAVIDQWMALSRQFEQQRQWTTCALMSHALTGSELASVSSDRGYAFGVRVTAVGEWLAKKYKCQWTETVAVTDVHSQFNTTVAETWLSAMEEGDDAYRQAVTVAFAALLREYDGENGSGNAWRREVERGLRKRLHESFGTEEATEDEQATVSDSNAGLWASLLVRGHWADAARLVEWVTSMAIEKLPLEAVQSFVQLRAESMPLASLLLLLVTRFDALRVEHEAFILQASRSVLLNDAAVPAVVKTQVLELLVLRFDLLILRSITGLEATLLAFYQPTNQVPVLTWTSTSEYAVCRLVVAREYAAAGRLVCSLWRVHPMLWDLENARLVLGNYLRALAKTELRASVPSVHQARARAFELYQNELL